MPLGATNRSFATIAKVSETAVRKADKAGKIVRYADGSIDVDASLAKWARGSDPARTKVREPANQGARTTPIRTEDEAKQAVALIARVLQGEGAADVGQIDFNAARTADTILKAHERDLKIAQRRKELVPIAKVKDHVGKAFIAIRQAVQRIPSRHAAAMAAELGCDPSALDAAMNKAIAAELDALSTPVVRA